MKTSTTRKPAPVPAPAHTHDTHAKEDSAMFTFTADSVTVKATTMPVEYTITPTGTVVMFAHMGEGKPAQPVRFEASSPYYAAAVAAAVAAGCKAPAGYVSAPAPADGPAKPASKRKPAAKPAPAPAKPAAEKPAAPAKRKPAAKPAAAKPAAEKPAAPAKPAPAKRKPAAAKPAPAPAKPAVVPGDKSFIGTSITGKGYEIRFDADAQRTRIILADDAPAALKSAILAAGFFFAPSMKSYNKKLSCKAYRVAVALAAQLDKLAA